VELYNISHLGPIHRVQKKRQMEKTFLEFQRQQVKEKMTEREKELEERRWYRRLAEGAADKAKVG
jgi:siroheme synthase (precorrin-2 oxidase/ferrochelatase)